MIIECDETSRPSTRKSNRITSAIKVQHPKSSRTHKIPSINKNDARKFYIDEISNDDFDHILKTDVLLNGHESINSERYYIKNMNLYRHIISNSQSTESNLDWILDLRTKNDSGFIIQNTKNMKCIEPSFYKKDLEKIEHKKSLEKKLKHPISMKENVQSINHIIKHRLGEQANIQQVDFELNLRTYENEKTKNNVVNQTKIWRQIPFIPKSKLFSSYNDGKELNENQKKEKDSRHKKKIHSKENNKNNENTNVNIINTLNNGKKKNFETTNDYLGENKSMKPYSEKYRVKNAGSIQHMLKKGTNSQALFESGLRDY